MDEQSLSIGASNGDVLCGRLVHLQQLEEFRTRHILIQVLQHRIRNVRDSDPHVTSGDSSKRLEQGVVSGP